MRGPVLTGDEGGFTLVELMIVTVILGIVAAIAAEAYTGIRRQAAAATVQADARKVPSAMEVHLAEHGDLPADLPALEAAGFGSSEGVCVSGYEVRQGDGTVTVTLRHRDYGVAYRFSHPGDAAPEPVDDADGSCLGEGSEEEEEGDDDGWWPPDWWPW